MQIGEFPLQQHVIVSGPRNVAGSPRAGAAPFNRFVHRGQYFLMLAHSEIIVGTPDNHLVTSLLKITRCAWEATGTPIEFGEDTVASFALKISQLRLSRGASALINGWSLSQIA